MIFSFSGAARVCSASWTACFLCWTKITFWPLLTLFWSNSKVTYVQAGVSFDQWNGAFCFHLGPIRASCVMSRFSSHAHHVIFQHGMQLWKTLVKSKPKRQSTFWLVILIYDQTKWILKGTDNILMSGYGNKCQNACRGKLNKRLIKLAGERIWSVHRVVQEMSVRL